MDRSKARTVPSLHLATVARSGGAFGHTFDRSAAELALEHCIRCRLRTIGILRVWMIRMTRDSVPRYFAAKQLDHIT